MSNKRPYILLEIIIALSLFSLCAVPLIRYPYLAFKKEISTLIEMEMQRVELLTLIEAKEWIAEHGQFDEILGTEIPLESTYIEAHPLIKKTIHRSCLITKQSKNHEGEDGHKARLLNCHIQLQVEGSKKLPHKKHHIFVKNQI